MKTIKKMIEKLVEHNIIKTIDDLTCYNYKCWKKCPFVFDCYNTRGDCLGVK